MYRIIKAFYWIFLSNYWKRKNIANAFTLILNSHEIKMKNVINVIIKNFQNLNREMKIKVNERMIMICVFIMMIIKNIFQQTNNDDFFRHFAHMNYRTCLCFKKKRKNLKFDIMNHDRYHRRIMQKRRKFNDEKMINKKIKILCKKQNLRKKYSIVMKLTSIFNLILIKIYDAFHFEWRELKKIFQNLFFSFILIKKNFESI